MVCILLFCSACEKDKSSEGVSRVTSYPIMELIGDEFLTLPVGGTFNDPGVIATIGSQQINPEVDGAVDVSTPGVYIITYSAANSDGFSAAIRRWVGVIDAAAVANDLTGMYQRTKYGTNTTPSGIATWTKVADGLYANGDIGGVGSATIGATPGYAGPFYIFNVEGDDLIFPVQPNPLGGDVYALSESGDERIPYTQGGAGTDSYTWSIRGSGYGTNPRTFTKQ